MMRTKEYKTILKRLADYIRAAEQEDDLVPEKYRASRTQSSLILADLYKYLDGCLVDKPTAKETLSTNVGASDYSDKPIQPWEIWVALELDPFRADLVKRLLRKKAEGGMSLKESRILDLKKMQHIITHMISLYETNNFPWEDTK